MAGKRKTGSGMPKVFNHGPACLLPCCHGKTGMSPLALWPPLDWNLLTNKNRSLTKERRPSRSHARGWRPLVAVSIPAIRLSVLGQVGLSSRTVLIALLFASHARSPLTCRNAVIRAPDRFPFSACTELQFGLTFCCCQIVITLWGFIAPVHRSGRWLPAPHIVRSTTNTVDNNLP